ncbi:MAG TPA: hypothetical protein PLF98_10375 [Thermotogota bacterium]|nr:hypothetical protein [Thermotogota bacterium]
MKKTFLVSLLVLTLCVLGFSDTMLGLRTIEATTTETTAASGETGKLSLKTIDPLLSSFRAGWKTPNLPGWSEATVGGYTFKLPAEFSLSSAKSGANIDAEIKDGSGRIFARLFIYQLDTYQLDELFKDLTTSLYGIRASGNKSFDEFSDLGNGKIAYLTKLTLSNETASLPILFLYQRGAQQIDVKSGTVVMLIVEPYHYQEADRQEILLAWIEGIGGSLIGAFTPTTSIKQTETVTPPISVITPTNVPAGQDFGALLAQRLYAEEWLSELPEGWETAYGEGFSVFHPSDFTPSYFSADDLEGFDFAFNGVTVAKLFVGRSEEELLVDELYQDLFSSYLSGLGNYNLVKKTPYLDMGFGFAKTFELSFSDVRAWIMIFSESIIEDIFEGEYIVFIGMAPVQEVETWKDVYLDVIMSIAF